MILRSGLDGWAGLGGPQIRRAPSAVPPAPPPPPPPAPIVVRVTKGGGLPTTTTVECPPSQVYTSDGCVNRVPPAPAVPPSVPSAAPPPGPPVGVTLEPVVAPSPNTEWNRPVLPPARSTRPPAGKILGLPPAAVLGGAAALVLLLGVMWGRR